MVDPSRKLILRCPRLGGEVDLTYCLGESAGRPCIRTLQCWDAVPPVRKLLMERLPEEEIRRLLDPTPRDRMSIILDAADRGKGR
ncbi:MAG: hypothetical protein CVU61_15565 [Deltaproteobacteria bacterium HGW-Deltaproteobacteria-19]|nr:MAG: hypothetical protein CVU61_15565 [Deltaproteobacteria bacterium HGW-Deltaproteobacteria-19]